MVHDAADPASEAPEAQPAAPLSAQERAELQRLRREVARQRSAGRAAGRPVRWLRWTAAVILLLVGGLLASASLAAIYVRDQLLDTDTYVQTVAPLAREPAVQDAIAAQISNAIFDNVDIDALVAEGLQALTNAGAPSALDQLAGPISSGAKSFIRSEINDLVRSPQFAQAWDTANRIAHNNLQAVLTGQQRGAVSVDDTRVVIDLGTILEQVKQQLVDRGLTIVASVPQVSIPFTVFESPQLPKLQSYVRLLQTAATWLPVAAIGLIAAGVAAAPQRRRGTIVAASMVGGVAVLLLVGITVAKNYYLTDLQTSVIDQQAATDVVDTVLRYLLRALRTLAFAALVVLLVALAAGSSRPAHALRRLINQGLDAAAAGLARVGLSLGRVPSIATRFRALFQILVITAAALALILANRPGIPGVAWASGAVLLTLGLFEIVARLPARAPAAPAS